MKRIALLGIIAAAIGLIVQPAEAQIHLQVGGGGYRTRLAVPYYQQQVLSAPVYVQPVQAVLPVQTYALPPVQLQAAPPVCATQGCPAPAPQLEAVPVPRRAVQVQDEIRYQVRQTLQAVPYRVRTVQVQEAPVYAAPVALPLRAIREHVGYLGAVAVGGNPFLSLSIGGGRFLADRHHDRGFQLRARIH